MITLGIESTAHTFGVGIIDENAKILANEKHSLVTEEGGILPREAADHHVEHASKVVAQAFKESGLTWNDIDLISCSTSPGLGPCLQVGLTAAKTLALANNKPLVGVNHCIAHIEIGSALTNAKDPIVLYTSGANTQIIGYEKGRYRVYGETLDMGIGNLLDTFGRALGLGFPAGPKIDEMYFKGKKLVELPYTVKGMDLNFSGLLTAAEQKIDKYSKEDMAYSLAHTAFAMLTEVTERALMHTEKKELLLGGGVALSKALRKMLQEMCEDQNVSLYIPPAEVCPDNGAMIAWLGYLMYSTGFRQKIGEIEVNQKLRTDQVLANWLKK